MRGDALTSRWLRADAVKFADGTLISVSARCEQAACSNNSEVAAASTVLTLSVADGGRGMTADECERAWTPYYRRAIAARTAAPSVAVCWSLSRARCACRAPTHRGGGTGLGACLQRACVCCTGTR
jgi:signal transduction histidine kinase